MDEDGQRKRAKSGGDAGKSGQAMGSWRGSSAVAQACECVCHNATPLSLPLLAVVLDILDALNAVEASYSPVAVFRGVSALSAAVLCLSLWWFSCMRHHVLALASVNFSLSEPRHEPSSRHDAWSRFQYASEHDEPAIYAPSTTTRPANHAA